MGIEYIISIIVAIAPSIVSVVGSVIFYMKNRKTTTNSAKSVIDGFESVRTEVMRTKEYEELKTQLAIAHQENVELKRTINKLLTKMDKISRTEE